MAAWRIGAWAVGAWRGTAWADEGALTEVPDVVGQLQADGTLTLEGASFVVAVATAYSSTIPAGEIISQVPAGGADAFPGSTVTITVSLGEAPPQVESSGGGGFWPLYEIEQSRRRRLRKLQAEREEEAERIQAELDRAIALELRKKEADEQRVEELQRLNTLVAQYADREAELAMTERVSKAFKRAHAKSTVSSLLALDKEIQRMLEEEEFLVLLMLANEE